MESRHTDKGRIILIFLLMIFFESCLLFEKGAEVKPVTGKYWALKNFEDPSSGLELVKRESEDSNSHVVIGSNLKEIYFDSSSVFGKFGLNEKIDLYSFVEVDVKTEKHKKLTENEYLKKVKECSTCEKLLLEEK